MTRLFDLPDPNPKRVLSAALSQGILLWEDGLEERTRSVWTHRRTWNRTDGERPLNLVALVAAYVALELYQDPGNGTDEERAAVEAHADDYLRKVLNGRMGFSWSVRDLGDELAQDYSPCITIHSSIHGGSWYVVGERDQLRMELLRYKEDIVLGRFVERFKERYPEIVVNLGSAPDESMDKAVSELYEKYRALWQEKLEASRATV